MAGGGRLLTANTHGGLTSYLHRPWLLATYRDLLANVGFRSTGQERFVGENDR